MKITTRLNTRRGNSELGWLKAFHTFSVPGFYDPGHERFGPLRIINEDRIAKDSGFGLHRHQDFEIFSYVVGGELEHRDSMGNVEILKRGDVQMTSAGRGIQHSEHAHGAGPGAHILQIWAFPTAPGLAPKYFTRRFSDAEKRDRWVRVVAPVGTSGTSEERDGGGPAPIHAPLTMFAMMLSPGRSVTYTFMGGEREGKDRKGFIQLPQISGYNPGDGAGAHVRVVGTQSEVVELREGDGAYVTATSGEEVTVTNVGSEGIVAEVLLFDME